MREIEFKITQSDDGRQIRDFLREFGVSAALLTKLKQTENGITLNGEFARTIDRLHYGDTLKIAISSNGKMPKKLMRSDIEVAYNDEDIIVFNKPPMMPVHESRNHQGDTLANVAACYIDGDNAFRAVYRLDRDTSGLVLIAKNELCACKLAGKIDKDYYAVCKGVADDNGTVNLPIARMGDSIIKRQVSPDGESAVTHWEKISDNGENSLLRLKLDTGRTHQIRVHLSHIGHPLLGDTLYGGDARLIGRQALHCKTIRFVHPVTGKNITVDCDFPQDFEGLI